MERNLMPLMRYFVYVGGALLALLLIANAFMPALPVAEAARSTAEADRSVIRIHSDRKWPERVVFDTSQPTIAPVPAPALVVAEAAAPPAKAAAPALKAGVREAFAELPANPARAEPKRKRKSVARNYSGQPRILIAQQRPAAFFGSNLW
jgi:hypothetical protein